MAGGKSGKTAASGKSAGPKDPRVALIKAALKLAAARPWKEISLRDIALEAGVTPVDAITHFATKTALLAAYGEDLDAALLTSARREPAEGSARDKLFDLLMRRFDLMTPDKAGLGSILKDSLCDPFALICGAFNLRRSLARTLALSDLSADGLEGQLKIKGLGLIYLDAVRVWLKDDSADMAKTMARLDRDLGRAEALVTRLSKARPDRTRPKSEAA